MGRVFSWEEIQNRRIPGLAVFKKAKEIIPIHLLEAGAIGGLFYGSDKPSMRSDIDCLVIYRPTADHRIKLMCACERMNRWADKHFVKIDWLLIDVEMAESGNHSIGPSFFAHLLAAATKRRLFGKNPLTSITVSSSEQEHDVLNYLSRKAEKLTEACTRLPFMEEMERLQYYQKVLEVSYHVARKSLWFLCSHNPSVKSLLSKQELILRYTRELKGMDDDRLNDLFRSLIDVDQWYTKTLTENLKSPQDPLLYQATLKTIEARFSEAIEFVRLNALMIRD